MTEFLFFLATPLLMLSGIPQTLLMIRQRSAKDVSAAMYAMSWAGVALLFAKSVQVGDTALIMANGVSIVMLTVNLALIFYFRRNAECDHEFAQKRIFLTREFEWRNAPVCQKCGKIIYPS